MTTIATDGKTMAGDGLAHCGGTIIDDAAIKVGRLADGRIYGFCGAVQDGEIVREWLNHAGEKPKPDDDFGCLILNHDGTVNWLSHKLAFEPAILPVAMGSGMALALGAMLGGATPYEAVQLAAQRDIYTGGKITVLERTIRNLEAA